MRPDRRRISSDEVIVEIKDSGSRDTNYWDLRGDDSSYSYRNRKDSEKGLTDEISVKFNLDENRNLTEEQKQVILNTLLRESGEDDVEDRIENFSNIWQPLPLLLLILIGAIIALILSTGGCTSTNF